MESLLQKTLHFYTHNISKDDASDRTSPDPGVVPRPNADETLQTEKEQNIQTDLYRCLSLLEWTNAVDVCSFSAMATISHRFHRHARFSFEISRIHLLTVTPVASIANHVFHIVQFAMCACKTSIIIVHGVSQWV